MYIAPCMKFTTLSMPKMMVRPMLIIAMNPPLTRPLKA